MRITASLAVLFGAVLALALIGMIWAPESVSADLVFKLALTFGIILALLYGAGSLMKQGCCADTPKRKAPCCCRKEKEGDDNRDIQK